MKGQGLFETPFRATLLILGFAIILMFVIVASGGFQPIYDWMCSLSPLLCENVTVLETNLALKSVEALACGINSVSAVAEQACVEKFPGGPEPPEGSKETPLPSLDCTLPQASSREGRDVELVPNKERSIEILTKEILDCFKFAVDDKFYRCSNIVTENLGSVVIDVEDVEDWLKTKGGSRGKDLVTSGYFESRNLWWPEGIYKISENNPGMITLYSGENWIGLNGVQVVYGDSWDEIWKQFPGYLIVLQAEPPVTCTVKNFQLPEDFWGIFEKGEEYIAGFGDPTYLVYWQTFPPGEDASWTNYAAWWQGIGSASLYLIPVAVPIVKAVGGTLKAAGKLVSPIKSVKAGAGKTKAFASGLWRKAKNLVTKSKVKSLTKRTQQALDDQTILLVESGAKLSTKSRIFSWFYRNKVNSQIVKQFDNFDDYWRALDDSVLDAARDGKIVVEGVQVGRSISGFKTALKSSFETTKGFGDDIAKMSAKESPDLYTFLKHDAKIDIVKGVFGLKGTTAEIMKTPVMQAMGQMTMVSIAAYLGAISECQELKKEGFPNQLILQQPFSCTPGKFNKFDLDNLEEDTRVNKFVTKLGMPVILDKGGWSIFGMKTQPSTTMYFVSPCHADVEISTGKYTCALYSYDSNTSEQTCLDPRKAEEGEQRCGSLGRSKEPEEYKTKLARAVKAERKIFSNPETEGGIYEVTDPLEDITYEFRIDEGQYICCDMYDAIQTNSKYQRYQQLEDKWRYQWLPEDYCKAEGGKTGDILLQKCFGVHDQPRPNLEIIFVGNRTRNLTESYRDAVVKGMHPKIKKKWTGKSYCTKQTGNRSCRLAVPIFRGFEVLWPDPSLEAMRFVELKMDENEKIFLLKTDVAHYVDEFEPDKIYTDFKDIDNDGKWNEIIKRQGIQNLGEETITDYSIFTDINSDNVFDSIVQTNCATPAIKVSVVGGTTEEYKEKYGHDHNYCYSHHSTAKQIWGVGLITGALIGDYFIVKFSAGTATKFAVALTQTAIAYFTHKSLEEWPGG